MKIDLPQSESPQQDVNSKSQGRLLDNTSVIRWCYEGVTAHTLGNAASSKMLKPAKVEETLWGNRVMGTTGGKQWTTLLCEHVVKEALIKLGRKNVRNTVRKSGSIRPKKYSPDLECDEFVYEVKGRSWCTSGTAGEKILGVPLKYGEVPRLYGKPLKIVLVGYQEYEARSAFAFGDLLDSKNQTKELELSLAFHKKQLIEYVAFTDILKEIGLSEGCWK